MSSFDSVNVTTANPGIDYLHHDSQTVPEGYHMNQEMINYSATMEKIKKKNPEERINELEESITKILKIMEDLKRDYDTKIELLAKSVNKLTSDIDDLKSSNYKTIVD